MISVHPSWFQLYVGVPPAIVSSIASLQYNSPTKLLDVVFLLPPFQWNQVTIGPKCGKDKLMQAVGRMRQLGKGQTLEFLGAPEVSWTRKSQLLLEVYWKTLWGLKMDSVRSLLEDCFFFGIYTEYLNIFHQILQTLKGMANLWSLNLGTSTPTVWSLKFERQESYQSCAMPRG